MRQQWCAKAVEEEQTRRGNHPCSRIAKTRAAMKHFGGGSVEPKWLKEKR